MPSICLKNRRSKRLKKNFTFAEISLFLQPTLLLSGTRTCAHLVLSSLPTYRQQHPTPPHSLCDCSILCTSRYVSSTDNFEVTCSRPLVGRYNQKVLWQNEIKLTTTTTNICCQHLFLGSLFFYSKFPALLRAKHKNQELIG